MHDDQATHQSERFEQELRHHMAALLELVADVCVAIRLNTTAGMANLATALENVRQLSDALNNLDMLGRALRTGDPSHLAWAARLQRDAWERDESKCAHALASTYGEADPRPIFSMAVRLMTDIEQTAARRSADLSGAPELTSPVGAGIVTSECGSVSHPAGRVQS